MQTIRYPREQMHRIAYTKRTERQVADKRLRVAENDDRAVEAGYGALSLDVTYSAAAEPSSSGDRR